METLSKDSSDVSLSFQGIIYDHFHLCGVAAVLLTGESVGAGPATGIQGKEELQLQRLGRVMHGEIFGSLVNVSEQK
jgi:hypothetical protein